MAAQGYKEIQLTTPLKDSLPLILHNDEASITCSAGIEFPEENLKEGMLCFRSDLQRLFQRRRGVWVDILASLDNDIIELGEAIVEAFNEVDEVVLKTKVDQSEFEKLKTEFEAFKNSVSANYVSKAELQAQIDEAYASLAGTQEELNGNIKTID